MKKTTGILETLQAQYQTALDQALGPHKEHQVVDYRNPPKMELLAEKVIKTLSASASVQHISNEYVALHKSIKEMSIVLDRLIDQKLARLKENPALMVEFRDLLSSTVSTPALTIMWNLNEKAAQPSTSALIAKGAFDKKFIELMSASPITNYGIENFAREAINPFGY